ncbi:hypothetical protein AB838_06370 [Rhodobacteraceae bacterium (ex Bugula neritina AB1)]|nr:hypothetical protein AB838_06370 [Rhodobacteraceae bacterium (ex Bugula neritina AB1)]
MNNTPEWNRCKPIALLLQGKNRSKSVTSPSLFSAEGTRYQQDYLGENDEGAQLPMLHIFTRSDDGIRHFWGSEMLFEPSPWQPRHVDALWPMWNLFDLTPDGRGDHMPGQR